MITLPIKLQPPRQCYSPYLWVPYNRFYAQEICYDLENAAGKFCMDALFSAYRYALTCAQSDCL